MDDSASTRGQHEGRSLAPFLRGLLCYVVTAIGWSILAGPLAAATGLQQSAHYVWLWGFVLLAPLMACIVAGPCRFAGSGAAPAAEPETDTLRRLETESSRYQTLVENLPVGIFHYDRELRITELNRRFAEILHVPRRALHRLDMTTLRDQRILEPLRAALAGRPARYEGEYAATLSGRQLRVTLRATPVFDADGRVTGGVGIVEDVSAQHEAESMLQEGETRYALAMRGTNEGLWDWNPQSRSLFLSSRLLSILGAEGDHLRTTSDEWLKLIHVQDRAHFQTALIAHLKGQTPHFECEYRLLDRSGEFRWVLARGIAQRDGNGIAYRMVGSIGDITERKRAEAGMRDLNRELESRVAERTAQLSAAMKELEAFSYSVSHDLRAPLRAIDGYSAILATDYDAAFDDEARQLFQRMRAAVQRMGMLIDDLLDLARVSRQSIACQPVNLSSLVAEIAADLQRDEPQRKVSVEIEPGLHTHADPSLLRIALENLVGNAWKFTARRDDAAIRFTRNAGDGGEDVFCIEDNGAGFDMRYADKLFGAFQRLHHERDFQGTGIGLATVARIVQRHGGRIWAHGEPGKGARFCFTLGNAAAEAAAPAGEARRRA
ncbi:sensor histidine kinase [Pseudothauera rhizosphaerae]|nr:ATP-binding protein [Pseudothauera rhizosphaerae]